MMLKLLIYIFFGLPFTLTDKSKGIYNINQRIDKTLNVDQSFPKCLGRIPKKGWYLIFLIFKRIIDDTICLWDNE